MPRREPDPPQEHRRHRNACRAEMETVEPKFACKAFACAIQDCLQKFSYNQGVCAPEVQALVDCCRTLPHPHGSLHCAGFLHLIRQPAGDAKEQREEHQELRRHRERERAAAAGG